MGTIIGNGWMPVKEFAQLKGVTVQAIYIGIKSGRYDSKKIGSYILVRE